MVLFSFCWLCLGTGLTMEPVMQCCCQCILSFFLHCIKKRKVEILIISPGPDFVSSPPLSHESQNIIAVVFYIIGSQRVGAITGTTTRELLF